jgi:isopenicillin N synthase-like dioxygenase
MPGAFIVNIGELLEVATGGYLRATEHRVKLRHWAPERISVPYFFNPRLDAQLPVLSLPRRTGDAGLSAVGLLRSHLPGLWPQRGEEQTTGPPRCRRRARILLTQ